jgi:hypothetical protein
MIQRHRLLQQLYLISSKIQLLTLPAKRLCNLRSPKSLTTLTENQVPWLVLYLGSSLQLV